MKASEDVRQAIGVDAGQPRLWLQWGRLQLQLGRPAQAQKAVERCLSLKPGWTPALTLQAEIDEG